MITDSGAIIIKENKITPQVYIFIRNHNFLTYLSLQMRKHITNIWENVRTYTKNCCAKWLHHSQHTLATKPKEYPSDVFNYNLSLEKNLKCRSQHVKIHKFNKVL